MKSNNTLAEKDKGSKPSPSEKEAGNTIDSEPEGKLGKYATFASTSVANTKSDDSANSIQSDVPASAPVPASVPTSNLSRERNRKIFLFPHEICLNLFPSSISEFITLDRVLHLRLLSRLFRSAPKHELSPVRTGIYRQLALPRSRPYPYRVE
jgi:hypothetical protein